MKKQYVVHYGSVPYPSKSFSSFAEASAFIKETLDAGQQIHSVSKEYTDDADYRDTLIRSIDIEGDR